MRKIQQIIQGSVKYDTHKIQYSTHTHTHTGLQISHILDSTRLLKCLRPLLLWSCVPAALKTSSPSLEAKIGMAEREVNIIAWHNLSCCFDLKQMKRRQQQSDFFGTKLNWTFVRHCVIMVYVSFWHHLRIWCICENILIYYNTLYIPNNIFLYLLYEVAVS